LDTSKAKLFTRAPAFDIFRRVKQFDPGQDILLFMLAFPECKTICARPKYLDGLEDLFNM